MANETIIGKLNIMVADVHVLIAKLHNYHWNVEGCLFMPLHKMTEAYYDHFFKVFDDVAERILQLGAKPPVTLKEYLELSGIQEEEKSAFSKDMVLNGVLKDFAYLAGNARELLKAADEDGDHGTEGMMGDLIGWLEKEMWLIRSTLGGGDVKFH